MAAVCVCLDPFAVDGIEGLRRVEARSLRKDLFALFGGRDGIEGLRG